MSRSEAQRAIDAVFRIESPRLIGALTRMVKDVGLAEELAQDALVAALSEWPESGVPENPGAWLMTTAKRRAINVLRHRKMAGGKHDEIARDVDAAAEPDIEAHIDDPVRDDLLRLVFIACHPVLSTEARVALTLRLLGGLTSDEIARAFLATEPTIAQRIVRAKRTLAEKNVAFEVPQKHELAERLPSVLEVVYLIFNEGYSATSGDDWMRPTLCADALRLGRVLAELLPDEAEVHGLVALMEIQASRTHARTGPDGEPVLLMEQNRAKWDQLLIHRGLAALERARAKAAQPGPYQLQAAIAACHARALTAEQTDWHAITALYGLLLERVPSPVVALNRAVAVGMALGPEAGLELVDGLVEDGALDRYHLLPAVRADLLMKLERFEEARGELEKAAELTENETERALLTRRAAACSRRTDKPS
ncbi:MAG: RNA polymerase sigma factor [Myxococcales bacterium]|nr:RNA polymerase sigma factor [Myxococcales bacterium]MCB9578925.1 RNA polymerase sigma factor [Polyangiaceae bacterium]